MGNYLESDLEAIAKEMRQNAIDNLNSILGHPANISDKRVENMVDAILAAAMCKTSLMQMKAMKTARGEV
jgi:hypothetical protein